LLRGDGSPKIDGMERNDAWLALISAGTLILFFFVWAALHDLAQGDEGTLEWTVFGLCVLAFPFLYRFALRVLTPKAQFGWLIGAGVLILLFSAGAASLVLGPKSAQDPMAGRTFLIVGLPALAVIGYHARRTAVRH
jgi:hypothetical protein